MTEDFGQFTSGADWSYTFNSPGDWEAATSFDFPSGDNPLGFPGLTYHAIPNARAEQIGNAFVFEAGPMDPRTNGVQSGDWQQLTCIIDAGCSEIFIEDSQLGLLTRDSASPVPLPSMLIPLVLCLVALRRKR